jgi:hypothetical protein
MDGTVYAPPRSDLPHVVVIFDDDGTVVTAQGCASVQDGEAMIEGLLEMIAKKQPPEWDDEPIDR